ncbi:ATP-binding cassette domain-containing protein [Kribbella solani]|uniref:Peptide/nickel transport system ATP-binding protein n=1 Tax=Kribbella solani TaxID=236067 RepID=A0A841DVX5_9ACTN|nr:ATP-binding cassette domain-containing protein [Kribbella solani]MBB5980896.1 peptide/nickel transport system ATP-binding protein [Kribbella solani]
MPDSRTVLLEAKDLSVAFRARGGQRGEFKHALKNVSLEVRRGERVGVVGESGSGKSTLGTVLAGLRRPDEGTVRFDGTDLATLSSGALRALRSRLQIVLQDPSTSLNPRMSVERIIREGLDVHTRLSEADIAQRVNSAMSSMRLPRLLAPKRPPQLSGGQRQRVAVARSLVLRPDLVILDEPVSALDMSVQAQLLNLLLDVQEAADLTYVFIVHDLRVARWFCDRILVMHEGEIVEAADSETFFERPEHPYSIGLLAAVLNQPPAPKGRTQ